MTIVQCPTCGAPTELHNRFVRVVRCESCGQAYSLTRDGVDPAGKIAALTDWMTPLRVGAVGTLAGRPLRVLGRVRYAWERGTWDEWYALLDDAFVWVHEDEGELAVVRPTPLGTPPRFEALRVGATVPVDGQPVYVTERRRARVEGFEGQVPRAILPGAELAYVDGRRGGEVVMLEFLATGVELFTGETVDIDDVEVD